MRRVFSSAISAIVLAVVLALGTAAPAAAQSYFYVNGQPYYLPPPRHNHQTFDSGDCDPYLPLPFSYINRCNEYVPSFDDWRSPGRG